MQTMPEYGYLEAQRFDVRVKANLMLALVSIAKQVINDYGILDGTCVLTLALGGNTEIATMLEQMTII